MQQTAVEAQMAALSLPSFRDSMHMDSVGAVAAQHGCLLQTL